MKLTEHPDPPETLLIITAENEREHEVLKEFTRPKELLTATIKHDRGYNFSHLTIRKGKS